MLFKTTNFASALLASSIDTDDTALAVASGFGARFPSLSTGEWFPLVVIDADGNTEIMRCTARASDVLTVTRAQEGTIARSFLAGSRIELRFTALALTSEIGTLEAGIAGLASHTITGGSLDLSGSPLTDKIQKFIGTLAADQTVIIPNTAREFIVINATTGNFFMLVKTTSGDPVCIPQGTTKRITCDGANVIYREDRDDVGKIEFHAGTTPPPGHFLCDGTTKIRALTPDLFGRISTTYGAPSGSTYSLPDYVTGNRFIRAAGGSIPVGTYQSNTVGPHDHSASGSVSGTISQITPAGSVSPASYTPAGSVSTTINQGSGILGLWGGSGFNGGPGVGFGSFQASLTASSGFTGTPQAFSFSGTPVTPTFSGSISVTVAQNTGTTETRPNNGAALPVIRY